MSRAVIDKITATFAVLTVAVLVAACQPAPAPWSSDTPPGFLDTASLDHSGTKLSVRGWTGDRNTTEPISVVLYVNGKLHPGAHKADLPRPDVQATTGRGARSGFDVTVNVPRANKLDVCVSAVNVGPGQHALLDCKTKVTRGTAPTPTTTTTTAAPTITTTVAPTTTTTTTTVPPPALGVSYPSGEFGPAGSSTVSPTVTGASGPVSYNITSGTLPDGVTFDPITGVFTGPGSWPTGMTDVAAGTQHSCGIDSAGGVWCWGQNDSGQLGDGTNTNSTVPVQVLGLSSGATRVAAGSNYSCAVVSEAARCWGRNWSGQLGDGTTDDSNVPVAVTGLSSGVTDLDATSSHSCAAVDGAAWCWGYNHDGQLGDGTDNNSSDVPVAVTGLSSWVTAVAAGTRHSCAVFVGGVRCWGLNLNGRLGNGTSENSNVPVVVRGLSYGVTAVAAGAHHSCAVASGNAQCWGSNIYGALGDGTTNSSSLPVQVTGLTFGVTAIATGSMHSCAVSSGGAQCWGANSFGRLGDGTTSPSRVPVAVTGLSSGVTAIAAGNSHSCTVSSSGAHCWGINTYGALGDGTDNNVSDVPVAVVGTGPLTGFPATLTVEASDGTRSVTATVTLTAPGL